MVVKFNLFSEILVKGHFEKIDTITIFYFFALFINLCGLLKSKKNYGENDIQFLYIKKF